MIRIDPPIHPQTTPPQPHNVWFHQPDINVTLKSDEGH